VGKKWGKRGTRHVGPEEREEAAGGVTQACGSRANGLTDRIEQVRPIRQKWILE
jgi:hypothetical protein